jgi:hypothetical protein
MTPGAVSRDHFDQVEDTMGCTREDNLAPSSHTDVNALPAKESVGLIWPDYVWCLKGESSDIEEQVLIAYYMTPIAMVLHPCSALQYLLNKHLQGSSAARNAEGLHVGRLDAMALRIECLR